MDSISEQTLARLIRQTRIAALGTIHDGKPNQAMVAIAFERDFSAFHIHVSRLGKHTTDMEQNPNVSVLVVEADDGRQDPQTLARVTLHGIASVIPRNEPEHPRIKAIYLSRFPEAEGLFSLGDFNIWKISPISGRFVADFGRAFNIVPEMLIKVSSIQA